MEERVGAGMKEAAKYLPIAFPENCMLPTVGTCPVNGAFQYRYGDGIVMDGGSYDRLVNEYPEHADDLAAIRAELHPLCYGERSEHAKTDVDKRLRASMACWGSDWGGHSNPDYDRYLHMGTNGIRALIEECRAKNPCKDGFYNGCRDAMDALDIVGGRIREMAASNALTDSERSAEWTRIAETFARVPMEPAYDMYSATMMFWMLFTLDGVDSPGRYDQFMIDYYNASTEEESRDMVYRFLEAMHNVRGWNVCISGSDEHWNDETNERHSGDATFADSVAAVPGCDVKGPTAALKSMMCYNQTEACSGIVTQMKFDKKLFATDKGIETFIMMAKTYLANGGQQLSINVLDRATLLAAQKNPEQYRNLVVRVGGYSDYFCNISKDLQQNVIDRSEFAF